MKKIYLIILVLLSGIVTTYAQATFSTGALDVNVNTYGRIRLLSADGVRHLQRASILVGTSASSVFDYNNDAESLEATVLVSNPQNSDYEIYGAYDNTYSNLPPNLIVKLYAYGWANGAYTIIKFNVKNNETTAINASIGLDIIPEIGQEYGFDSVTYNSTADVVRFHRGADVNMGLKQLSGSLSSLYSFEWFSDYDTDANYWTYMNFGSLQSQYASNTADGPVTITSQAPVLINPGQSVDVYYAFSLGNNESTMLAGIAAAEQKYDTWVTSVQDIDATKLTPGKNFPNPFENSTTITYSLPESGAVSIDVFDALGNKIKTLVNESQTKGSYSLPFDAENLAGGVYYYTIRLNNMVTTSKMFVIK
jgi:hypothetical protein